MMIRMQLAQKVAFFSDSMGLCRFYEFIRGIDAVVDIVVQSKKGGNTNVRTANSSYFIFTKLFNTAAQKYR